MFKDYYKILGIDVSASAEDIKSAYREMSRKWHPDKNPNKDVTEIMQDINEAYSILKDSERRRRYNIEYATFKSYQKASSFQTESQNKYHSTYSYNYDIKDDVLKDYMKEAHDSAVLLVSEFLKSFKKASSDAVRGAWDNVKGAIVVAIFLSILGFFLLLIAMVNM